MKRHIKSIIVTGLILFIAAALLVAGISYFYAEKNSFPSAGIYFAEHNSWLSWTDERYNPYFDLVLYEVKGEESFLEFSEMALRDAEGNEYPLKDASIRTVFSDIFFASYRITCVLDRQLLGEGETLLKEAVLSSPEGAEHSYSIGTVALFVGNQGTDSQLQFSSGTAESSVLNSYNIQVTNAGEDAVAIHEVLLGLDGITVSEFGYYDEDNRYCEFNGEILLNEGESVILHCAFTGAETYRQDPFTEIRPAFGYTAKGESCIASVSNTAEYFAAFTRQEIKDYLWGLYERTAV